MFIKLLCILFPLLINGANENLLCIAEQPFSVQNTNRTFMSSVDYSNLPAIQKEDYLKKIHNEIKQVKEKNKLYFSSTEAIINFVEHGNFIRNNIPIISKIRHIGKCLPYSSKSAYNNLIPEDNFIKSVLKKIEKRFLNEIDDYHLLNFFNQINSFHDPKDDSLKLILDIQNNETQIKKNNPQEKLFCIVDETDLERKDISFVTCETNNTYDDEKKIKQNISDLMTKNKKLGFYSTASIIAFIKLGLPNNSPKTYLKNLIYTIEKRSPYNDNDQYIFNIQPGDTLIEFILEKIEKILFGEVVLALDFNENIEFYEEDSVKKIRLKKHDHATIKIQDSLKQEEKESVPPQKNTLFQIKDKNSPALTTVSYNCFFNDTNRLLFQSIIQTNLIDMQQKITKKEPIFFTNFNAIKNYIYFAIGYNSTDKNDLNQREILFKICDALSQRPPYNTQRYQFKPKDPEIIELLEILEKIHNKELKEDEFKSYYEQIIKVESISATTIKQDNDSKEPNNYEQMKTKNPEKNTPVSNTISAPENKKSSSENKNPSLKKSSIIKYLFGLTVCAASLICLYKFFNPYILKRIY